MILRGRSITTGTFAMILAKILFGYLSILCSVFPPDKANSLGPMASRVPVPVGLVPLERAFGSPIRRGTLLVCNFVCDVNQSILIVVYKAKYEDQSQGLGNQGDDGEIGSEYQLVKRTINIFG